MKALTAEDLNLLDAERDTARFWSKVETGPGCWLWTAADNGRGYGNFSIGPASTRRMWGAHRVAFLLSGGVIPEGAVLDHLCRTTRCVRPDHLEPVSQRENCRRGVGWSGRNARKEVCGSGHSLLDPANVRIDRDGGRACRACAAARQRERRRDPQIRAAHYAANRARYYAKKGTTV